jgi:lipoate-protein ligase A
VERVRGGAGELHALDVPAATRLVRVHEVTTPAVVLGSAQPASLLDAGSVAAAGREVARRRSGGGIVTLAPGEQVWVDVVVPAGDPLWDDDVCHASWWLGEVWARALGGPGAPVDRAAGTGDAGDAVGLRVHRGGVSDRDASRIACFAALGPGEVVAEGAKVVGISQRRTRHWARFQCVAYRRWDPRDVLDLLDDSARTAAVEAALVERVAPAVPPGWDVVEHFVPLLPA